MKGISKFFIISAAILLTVGCKSIPEAYVGLYQDSSRRITLELDSFDGKLKLSDGRTLSGKLEKLNFEKVSEGKRAIYARENSHNNNQTEIYMLNPDLSTRQSAEGFIWFESEIIYSLIEPNNADKSRQLTLIHCRKGMVLLDSLTQKVQLGCPENPEQIDLVKTRDGRY